MRSSESGFSFIEIMVVVIILGILAAVVLPRFTGRTEEARVNSAMTQLNVFATALDAYELDSGRYPDTEQGLAALVEEPTLPAQQAAWKGPYLRRGVPVDPWGNPYQYRSPGLRNTRSYDVWSYGPDGVEGGEDEITNW